MAEDQYNICKKRTKITLIIGGSLEIIMGLLHFIFLFQMKAMQEYALLPKPQADMLYLLDCSVGILLICLGLLCFYFAIRVIMIPPEVRFFAGTQAVLMIGRLILEFIFPVHIRLSGIDNPHPFVATLLVIVIIVFTLSSLSDMMPRE